jgi:hypothetical protein
MITHKSHLAPIPFKVGVQFKKKNWYLFPQSETCKKSVADIRYVREGDVYSHDHFWFYSQWRFFWLFFVISIQFKEDRNGFAGPQEVRHERPKHLTSDGQLF